MIAVLTLLTAFPLGLLVRRRTVAYLAYGLAFAHVFTFQTLTLLLGWQTGDRSAFGTGESVPWDYLLVSSAIYAVGMGLVTLGAVLRARREGRRAGVDLAAARG